MDNYVLFFVKTKVVWQMQKVHYESSLPIHPKRLFFIIII